MARTEVLDLQLPSPEMKESYVGRLGWKWDERNSDFEIQSHPVATYGKLATLNTIADFLATPAASAAVQLPPDLDSLMLQSLKRTKTILDISRSVHAADETPSVPSHDVTPANVRRYRGPIGNSSFKGVTKHQRTKRWEAHIWEKKKQLYLGAHDKELSAARAYDVMAIKLRGMDHADTNFPLDSYESTLRQILSIDHKDLVCLLRRRCRSIPRGVSEYRGVTQHKGGRWEARMGQYEKKKYVYLGLFGSEEEGAVAYDRAAVRYNGLNAITNYPVHGYPNQLFEYYHASAAMETNQLPCIATEEELKRAALNLPSIPLKALPNGGASKLRDSNFLNSHQHQVFSPSHNRARMLASDPSVVTKLSSPDLLGAAHDLTLDYPRETERTQYLLGGFRT